MVRIYNTLSRKVEEFIPEHPVTVGMYACGPTVYDNAHIGHMRKYTMDDVLVRLLRFHGFQVTHIMNITDVGHLVSDEDTGEDKMEKGARKYGLSVWDIAKKFEKQFFDSADAVHIQRPDKVMHATDYIKEQIALVKALEEKGYTYTIEKDGVYFDTSKFPDYFKLSRQNPQELKKGARVEFVEGKRNPGDFALWKFSHSASPFDSAQGGSAKRRQMEWDSPWGTGFPGWHIECSAMSLEGLFHCFSKDTLDSKKVGTVDIHTGGIDHIPVHHTNEIAQSECATGKKFVNFWVHHNFLIVEGEKMSKSLGNIVTVQDVQAKGYDPLALRYLYLQTHYRQEMNFTWESLEAAQTALHKLRGHLTEKAPSSANVVWMNQFTDALDDDLNTSKALSVVWEMVKADLPEDEKNATLLEMDTLLGLELDQKEKEENIPQEVMDLVWEREGFRKVGDFSASDEIRDKIKQLGFEIIDTKEGPQIKKNRVY